MKRSLALKLAIAFLLVSVVGVALAALIFRLGTQREFDQFVLKRYQVDLIGDLSEYYERNGSWDEINAIVLLSPRTVAGVRAAAVSPAPLTLVGEDGTVVYSRGFYQDGQQVPREELDHAVPVNLDGDVVGWVLFADLPTEEFVVLGSPETEFLAEVNRATLLGALGAVLVALLFGILLARTISRPVREVTVATQNVAQGDLGYQVPVRTRDELGELAASFNKMSADLAQANELRRQMTADIAHELRNPLSVILGYIESLDAGKLEPTPEAFGIMHRKGAQLQRLIDDLRILALADAGELPLTLRPVAPRMLLEHAALAHMVRANDQGIDIEVVAESESLPAVQVDPERMAQVLGNLVSNALRYTAEGGAIVLSAECSGEWVSLQVRDSGQGIRPEDLPYIFDRFYRGDKSRPANGESGLGLAIARSVVEAHGGTISAESTPGQGSAFEIALPLSG